AETSPAPNDQIPAISITVKTIGLRMANSLRSCRDVSPVSSAVKSRFRRISIRSRARLLPPGRAHVDLYERFQIRIVGIGIETQVGCDPDAPGSGAELQESRRVEGRDLLPELPPSGREIDPVERQRVFLRPPNHASPNHDRLAVFAPLHELV